MLECLLKLQAFLPWQEIGLGSLGTPDDYLIQLSTVSRNNLYPPIINTYFNSSTSQFLQLYWFTIEVGICKQEDRVIAYGGNLLSQYKEIEVSAIGQLSILLTSS